MQKFTVTRKAINKMLWKGGLHVKLKGDYKSKFVIEGEYEKEKCADCNSPFEYYHHRHIAQGKSYHRSCYKKRYKKGEPVEECFCIKTGSTTYYGNCEKHKREISASLSQPKPSEECKPSWKSECCNAPFVISKSTRFGTRRLCNGCGKQCPISPSKIEEIDTSMMSEHSNSKNDVLGLVHNLGLLLAYKINELIKAYNKAL